jgi:hypothetical protein
MDARQTYFSFLKSDPVQAPITRRWEGAYSSRSLLCLFNPARIPAIGGPAVGLSNLIAGASIPRRASNGLKMDADAYA